MMNAILHLTIQVVEVIRRNMETCFKLRVIMPVKVVNILIITLHVLFMYCFVFINYKLCYNLFENYNAHTLF